MTDMSTKSKAARTSGRSSKLGTFLSELITRASWLSRAGLTHGSARNLWTVFGYKTDLTVQDLYIKYKRQDIARTIVEAPADALWTRPPRLKDADETFAAAWEELINAHDLWSILNRADYMTGFGRYAIVVVGLDDGLPLDQPAQPVQAGAVRKVTYLQPYSELGITIQGFENNSTSPRYGLPTAYQVMLNETEQGAVSRRAADASRLSFTVHHSRVIHIGDGIVEDPVYGTPRLESVFNLLDDLLKMSGGAAETYWLTANRGMQINIEKDMELGPEDEEALAAEVDEYYHGLRRFMRTRGVEMTELGSRVADPTLSINAVISLIAATTRIPQRLLMGAEAGQLASEQDRANWAERVQERRSKFGEPRVLKPTIKKFVELGALPVQDKLMFEWPDAFILAPLERAQTSAQKARSATNLSKVLTDNPNLLTVDEIRNIIGLGDTTSILNDNPNRESDITTRV